MSNYYRIRKNLKLKHHESILYRIEALKYLPEHRVKVGDLGG